MIKVDGYELDYPDDNVSRRFRDWLLGNRNVEHEFNALALSKLKEGLRTSGYAIVQFLRMQHAFKIANDFGPILARLAVAKHPELKPVFGFKPTGWGKVRTKNGV